MTKPQTPIVYFSPLTRRWFVTTKYVEKKGISADEGTAARYMQAVTKFDIDDQMSAILAGHKRNAQTVRGVRRRLNDYRLSAGAHTPVANVCAELIAYIDKAAKGK